MTDVNEVAPPVPGTTDPNTPPPVPTAPVAPWNAGVAGAPPVPGLVAPPPLTAEQIAQAKAAELAQKAAEAAARKAAKEEENRVKAAQKAEEKAKREAARAEERAAKIAEKAAQKAAAEKAKADSKMPEMNGVRRPKPDTICGRNWATYDAISAQMGRPCAISEAMAVLRPQGVNDATIRTQYAHWRKYNGVTGRVVPPPPAPVIPPVAVAPAPPPVAAAPSPSETQS